MSIRWNALAGEHYCISCPRSGKGHLENSTMFPVYEVEKLNWRDIRYFMPTKWKSLTGELYNILCPWKGKFN